jgi:hypothetical protein
MRKRPNTRHTALRSIQDLILRGGRRAPSPTQAYIEHVTQEEQFGAAAAARATQLDEEQRIAGVVHELPTEQDLQRIERDAKATVAPEITDKASDVAAAEHALAIAARDLKAFKAKNKPDHEARYNARAALRILAVAVPAFLLDLGASLFLLAGHLAHGGKAGIAYTLGTDAALVLLGLLAAGIARYLFHSHWLSRALGFLGLSLISSVIGVASIAYAHFRDATLHGGLLELDAKAILKALHHPFELTYAGWLLFVLGVLTSIAAAHAAFVSDDKIPGYGKVARAVPKANRTLQQCEKTLAQLRSDSVRWLGKELNAKLREAHRPLRKLHEAASSHAAAADVHEAESAQLKARAAEHHAIAQVIDGVNASPAISSAQHPVFDAKREDDRHAKAADDVDALLQSVERRCTEFLDWFNDRARVEKGRWHEAMTSAEAPQPEPRQPEKGIGLEVMSTQEEE